MKVAFINPFITATITTFEMMLKVKLLPGKPEIKTQPFPSFDISGIIGLSGDAIGSVVLSYPKIVALMAVSKFVGAEIKTIGPDVTDAIGELTNIVAGSAKAELQGMNVSISLPSVIMGRNHQISNPSGLESLVIPFNSEIGKINLEVCLKTK